MTLIGKFRPPAGLLVLAAARVLLAQDPLSIGDAVSLALQRHPAQEAAASAVDAASSRLEEARGGYLPKLNYQESYQRSDNPVFVFGSLLTQHQFGPQNFEINRLNQPDSLGNFQSLVTLDQVVFDGGRTRAGVRAAELGKAASVEDQRGVRMEVIERVARAYYDALLSDESLRVAEEAVRSAEADLQRAQAVRAAGLSTDADVLSIRVHLAAIEEQKIRRGYERRTSRAALNDALGLPLDDDHNLTSELTPLPGAPGKLEELEREAAGGRPETHRARLALDLAGVQSAAARSAYLPQVSLHAAFEADRQNFGAKGGANWMVGTTLRWNLFNGFSSKAAVRASAFGLTRARAGEREVASGVRLQVRRAYHEAQASRERVAMTEAAVALAEENLRIIKNRYEAGLTTVTELLRSEVAVLEARTRRIAAVHDQRVASLALELAAGTLSPDSAALH